jgi:hypothetical protein
MRGDEGARRRRLRVALGGGGWAVARELRSATSSQGREGSGPTSRQKPGRASGLDVDTHVRAASPSPNDATMTLFSLPSSVYLVLAERAALRVPARVRAHLRVAVYTFKEEDEVFGPI